MTATPNHLLLSHLKGPAGPFFIELDQVATYLESFRANRAKGDNILRMELPMHRATAMRRPDTAASLRRLCGKIG